MKRKWDVSSKDTRKMCIEELLARIEEQKGSEFGVILAEDLIAIVSKHIGPDIYNLALNDSRKVIQNKLSDLEIDLDLLTSNS